MRLIEEELVEDGWTEVEGIPGAWHKPSKVGQLFVNKRGHLCEVDLAEFADEKKLNSILNYLFDTEGQRKSGEKFKAKYKNWQMVLALKLLIWEDIVLESPDGEECYTRYAVSTDPGYKKGMKVIADVQTEKVLLKHFDNVYSVAIKRGFKHKI